MVWAKKCLTVQDCVLFCFRKDSLEEHRALSPRRAHSSNNVPLPGGRCRSEGKLSLLGVGLCRCFCRVSAQKRHGEGFSP